MSLKSISTEYYGDETRWFVGVVESVKDPLKQGRVRVRIFGVHSDNASDIPTRSLPWAQVVAPVTHAGTSGRGGTPVGIKPTALVFGIFLDGKHSQLPLVLGSIPKIDGQASVSTTTGIEEQREGSKRSGRAPVGVPPALTGDVLNNGGSAPLSTRKFEGGSNVEKVYNYLERAFREEMGLKNSKELAAGFTGNFQVESGYKIDPNAFNPAGGGQGANGIAQWRGARLENLQKFARSEGVALVKNDGGKLVPNLKTQAAFVIHEISGGDPYETSNFNKYIKNAATARLAGDAVGAHYERGETELRFKSYEVRYKNPTIKKRIDYAAEVYAAMAQRKVSNQAPTINQSGGPS